MAVIAFTDAGSTLNAVKLLNTMTNLQLANPDGAWYECYDSADTSVCGYNLVSGPIAWMVIAINFHAARTGDTKYAGAASRALSYLDTMRDMNLTNETYAALRYSPNYTNTFSTEHNLDAYSAYLYRGLLSSNNLYLTTASNILEYLAREMWAPSTNSNGPYHDQPIFWSGWDFAYCTDPQSWGVLALGPLGPNGEEYYRCMEWLWWNERGNTRNAQNFSPSVTGVDGFRPGTGDRPHIWVEGTEGVVRAFYRVSDYAGGTCNPDMVTTNSAHGEYFHQQMARIVSTNGGLVHSFWDFVPGDYRFPENARWNHVASVAWHYFNERRLNPFSPPLLHRGPITIHLTGNTNGPVQLGWQAVPGWPYKVQWRGDLREHADTWHDLGASANGTGTSQWFTDCSPLQTHRFYRVVLGK